MGDVDLVWVRGYSVNGRDVLTLARESEPTRWLTAADVREILGDEPPVVACDDSGPDGAIIFPDRHDIVSGQIASAFAEQLRTAIRRRALAEPCPAESFPEPGDVGAGDFAEPAGGEAARVAAEEAAHDAALKAGAAAVIDLDIVERHRYHGWQSGDRFIVRDKDDVARDAAALYLWPTWGSHQAAGHVVARCEIHHTGHDTSPGLLVDCEGIKRPIVVAPCVLSACARKVTS